MGKPTGLGYEGPVGLEGQEGFEQPAWQLAQAACPVVLVWLILCVFGEQALWRLVHSMAKLAVLLPSLCLPL